MNGGRNAINEGAKTFDREQENKSASPPLLHVTCWLRGTFFFKWGRGEGLKYLRSGSAKQVERKLAWCPGGTAPRSSGVVRH